ncbi:hypothetical protein [Collinsella vaginalis]|uniref:hypothetical protein n=1 Tax=Collinsella vaginalis TaxID=1870987 RepID=UPI000A2718EE|nr:hypothetical protein [Collinsella vaginalis]
MHAEADEADNTGAANEAAHAAGSGTADQTAQAPTQIDADFLRGSSSAGPAEASEHGTPGSPFPAAPDPTITRSPARRIGLVDVNTPGERYATRFLLNDFAEALLAYDRVSDISVQVDEPPTFYEVIIPSRSFETDDVSPETVSVEPADTSGAEPRQEERNSTGKSPIWRIPMPCTHSFSNLDTLVIGFGSHGKIGAGTRFAGLSTAGLPPERGTRVYAIGTTDEGKPSDLIPALTELHKWCHDVGAIWCGGVTVTGGDLILLAAHAPRMGCLRRNCSEAIDRLIGAVRGGYNVLEAALVYGAPGAQVLAARRGLIEAAQPLPATLRSLLIGWSMRRSKHKPAP